ncbi:iron ABC transporter permease [Macrococcus sp. DPC7161]|uniref:FecCD family ABC transporter permease n=1 Tax=Macrococcus sp. DPC7161 TaxID=2507060 RepID=UPI00100BBB62|nr:iron ABC transporter permease [Macrococcus sp. DPC7161]RXK18628.1 iron ABC transporter permease [Macrococcus sp. DPC7161]
MARFMNKKQTILIISLAMMLLVVMSFSMTIGEFKMSPLAFFKTLFGFGDNMQTMILYEFRMPKMLVTILCGAALSLAGAILQSITKNPLADPGIVGINAGSGLFVVLLLLFIPADSNTFIYILPMASLLGGFITALFVFFLSYKHGEINPVRMILIGVGLSTAFSGLMLMITTTFRKEQVAFISEWLAGSIWGDTWPFVIVISICMLIVLPLVFYKATILNILNTHEHVSTGIGVHVAKERLILLILSVFLSASAVSICGAIGFIGLLAPHIAKGLVGPKHQTYLPISLLLGSILLSLSEVLGRVVLQPNGIPAGIIVSIIGAPYFLYLMKKAV